MVVLVTGEPGDNTRVVTPNNMVIIWESYMVRTVSRKRLEDGVAGNHDDDGFVQIDLIKQGQLVGCRLLGARPEKIFKGWRFVHAPGGGGFVDVVGGPSSTPCGRVEGTGRCIGANNDVGVGGLEEREIVAALVLFTVDQRWDADRDREPLRCCASSEEGGSPESDVNRGAVGNCSHSCIVMKACNIVVHAVSVRLEKRNIPRG